MKKSLIALALAAVATSATAQDAKIYGVLDASQYRINNDSNNYTGFNSKAASTSRFGILVNEDLGKGLKAGASIETEIGLTDGATGSTSTGTAAGTFNRAANVFLDSKDYGRLVLGRMVAPVFASAGVGDALGVNSLGFVNSVVASAANTNRITGETRLHPNGDAATVAPTIPGLFNAGVAYTTPKIANFSATIFHTPNSGTANSDFTDNGQRDMVLNYGDGTLNVAVGQSVSYNSTGGAYAKRNLYAANYTIGALKVTGGLYQTRYDAYNDIDVKAVGAKYQATPKVSFGASYTETEDKTVLANKSKTVGVAGFYDFSKRTQAYGLVGRSNNEGSTSLSPIYGTPASGVTLAAGKDITAYTVGLRHSF